MQGELPTNPTSRALLVSAALLFACDDHVLDVGAELTGDIELEAGSSPRDQPDGHEPDATGPRVEAADASAAGHDASPEVSEPEDAGWDIPTPADCAPQAAYFVGACEPGPRYFWIGNVCLGLTGCECKGDDCDAGFASVEACEAAYAHCWARIKPCGGFAANTCDEGEYCAYHPNAGSCGITDGSAACALRPDTCDTQYEPVCGCDNKTYPNACEAHRAGIGLSGAGSCES